MGEEGVDDQEDLAPEAGPPREPSISSDTPDSAVLKVARDPGDPTMKEREDHNASHIPFRSWCPIFAKAKEGKRRTEMEEEKRNCQPTNFIRLQNFLPRERPR